MILCNKGENYWGQGKAEQLPVCWDDNREEMAQMDPPLPQTSSSCSRSQWWEQKPHRCGEQTSFHLLCKFFWKGRSCVGERFEEEEQVLNGRFLSSKTICQDLARTNPSCWLSKKRHHPSTHIAVPYEQKCLQKHGILSPVFYQLLYMQRSFHWCSPHQFTFWLTTCSVNNRTCTSVLLVLSSTTSYISGLPPIACLKQVFWVWGFLLVTDISPSFFLPVQIHKLC